MRRIMTQALINGRAVVTEVLAWAALLTGVWVGTAPSLNAAELMAGAGGGVLLGLAARRARHAYGARWRPSWRWMSWLGALPWVLLVDVARLARTGVSRGKFRVVRLPRHDSPEQREARLALAMLALAASPASYPVMRSSIAPGSEHDAEDKLVLRVLGPPSRLEAAVRR